MSKGLITVLVVIGVIVVFGFIFFSWGTGVYDNAVKAQEEVNNAWSNVQTMYQRRADLVPQLVATVKGAAENEKSILTQVTQARAGIVNAKTPDELDRAGKQINTAINLAFEAYPQIRSTENFQDLQSQLEGSENRISVARERYNKSVKDYNSYVRGYWKKMALNWFGGSEDFSVRKGFEASEGADKAPTVDFSSK
ncbi:MAG: LemA family protein [Cytophagales bacterium]|jgi:LemA protein|nr:LemA family protein [Bacteroidota bacterium]MBS1981833.1 LemA family protein [Bacteroidota bacterium]WHZ07453.1 MAG: LemA family protein [Cytophagales bacterium]